jgi:hypothetical protein
MARRASSRIRLPTVAGAILLLAGLGIGTYFLVGRASDPYRTLQPLDVAAYFENANSLRGNVYKIDARVLNLLHWDPAHGRLFSLEIDQGRGDDPVGVLIPPEFNPVNVQRGQNFRMKVEVGPHGLLVVRDIMKQ